MTNISAFGISTVLPTGWEGRISQRRAPTAATASTPEARAAARAAGSTGWSGERPNPVAHFANFALPANRGDFGSGVVNSMTRDDVFVVLFEYGPESVGKPLFAGRGLPRRLRADQFHPKALQQVLPGQSGHQTFFTESGRAFCLYVVLGSHANGRALVGKANQVLAATKIQP